MDSNGALFVERMVNLNTINISTSILMKNRINLMLQHLKKLKVDCRSALSNMNIDWLFDRYGITFGI